MNGRWREAAAPLLAILGAALYFVGIDGAHASARRFPVLVIVLLLVLAGLLLVRARAAATDPPGETPRRAALASPAVRRRAGFVALAMAYYPAFTTLGFDLANLLFLAAALPLAGLAAERGAAVRAVLTAGVALLLAGVFRALATALDLNLPPGMLDRWLV